MAQNYLNIQRQSPFNSFLQGFTGGQQIMGNIAQQQMVGIKNRMMQEEYDKQKAVQNAMTKYGTPEFNEQDIMKADPEMGLKLANLKRQMTAEQLKLYGTGMEVFEKMSGSMIDNPGLYHQTQQKLKQAGIDLLPGIEHFVTPDGKNIDLPKFQNFIKQAATGSKLWLEEGKAGMKPPHTEELKVGDKIFKRQWNQNTKQWEVVGEAPRWNDNPLAEITTQNPDGTITTTRVGGKPGQGGMGNPPKVQGEIYTKLMGHKEDSVKLNDMVNNFNPQYQTYGGKAWNMLIGMWDKINPNNMSEEQAKYLEGFSAHKADSYKLLNLMLNRLSGAAVSEHEMKRLTQQLPNPGTGLTDGDSPKQFAQKLKSFQRDNALAIARYTKWAKEGVVPQSKQELDAAAKKFSLDDMDRLLKNRAITIKQDMVRQYPQMTEDQVNQATHARLKQEYNLP